MTLVREVVALYVDPRGPYPSRVAECYDERRDARTYTGSLPVVAHPPCGPWGGLRHLSAGHGVDLGPLAVELVRRVGGVLEHPAGSKLWEACELPKPYPKQGDPLPHPYRDAHGGYSVQVDQVEWGHVARKTTWLYVVGLDPRELHDALQACKPFAGAVPTHWVSGGRNKRRKGRGGVVPVGIKVCSAEQRRRTPPRFADFLIAIAQGCHRGT
jgi:hypothetical protein